MQKQITLIFPHQLFAEHPALDKSRTVWLMEDSRFFIDFRYHKQKLILHRASMRYYQDWLRARGYRVRYFDYMDCNGEQVLIRLFKKEKIQSVHIGAVYDHALESLYTTVFAKVGLTTTWYETPMFMTDADARREYVSQKKAQNFLLADFYTWQRKRLNILVEGDKPIGGKWSFDTENRKKLPKEIVIPEPYTPKNSKYTKEAIQYVDTYFAENYGQRSSFAYPISHHEAIQALDDFLQHRFALFGDYEDAISAEHTTVFHSVLSSSLNIGLLTPTQVIDRALAYAQKHTIPLNAVEGFVRQIIGWREFMYVLYEYQGKEMQTSNYFDHHRMIPVSWYQGKTGLDPIDVTIKKVLKTGYAHHIERLMILGNMMLLSEFDPSHVYQWFMELFIDAYDWVMVPNVYGMSQYADGGVSATKPYISASAYIRKMSDYARGDWCEVWDALYWYFIATHAKELNANPRMKLMVVQYEKIPKSQKTKYTKIAKQYLDNLGVSAYV